VSTKVGISHQPQELPAVDRRQVEIEQYHVGQWRTVVVALAAQELDGTPAIGDHRHPVANLVVGEDVAGVCHISRIVLDQQDVHGLGRAVHRVPSTSPAAMCLHHAICRTVVTGSGSSVAHGSKGGSGWPSRQPCPISAPW
jgi:hypothetical protein